MVKAVRRVGGAIAAGAAVGAVAVAFAAGGASASAAATAVGSDSGCQLAHGVKHVIEVTFDNVHYNRDNPNVLSDLEQMPALLNFITSKGTLLSNNHTPLIAHTADDTITNYSGLYGDRQGQGITNTYETYGATGTVTPKSSFAYWTGTYGLDSFPQPALFVQRLGRRRSPVDPTRAVVRAHSCRLQRRRRLDGQHGTREPQPGPSERLRRELASSPM